MFYAIYIVKIFVFTHNIYIFSPHVSQNFISAMKMTFINSLVCSSKGPHNHKQSKRLQITQLINKQRRSQQAEQSHLRQEALEYFVLPNIFVYEIILNIVERVNFVPVQISVT